MSIHLKHLVTLSVLILFSLLATTKVQAQSWQKEIELAVQEELANSGTASLQVAIATGGQIVYQLALGKADIENKVAATNESKYRIGSVSKWFTSALATVLIENGSLDPEAPIQKYCPQFPQKEWPITANLLLRHRSGIRHYIDYDEQLKQAQSSKERSIISLAHDRERLSSYTRYLDVISPLELFKEDALLFEPNTNWEYSSLGYRVLACVLEGAAKLNYSEAIQELIFNKVNMPSTTADDAWGIIPNRTAGYRIDRQKNLRRADLRDISENLAAGGYLSTASDLALFALAVNSGNLFTSGEQLKSKLGSEAYKRVVAKESSWRNAIPSENYYGDGLMFFPDKSHLWVGHTGRIAGGSAIVVLQPENDLSIAVLTNAKGWNGYISFVDKLKAILGNSSKYIN